MTSPFTQTSPCRGGWPRQPCAGNSHRRPWRWGQDWWRWGLIMIGYLYVFCLRIYGDFDVNVFVQSLRSALASPVRAVWVTWAARAGPSCLTITGGDDDGGDDDDDDDDGDDEPGCRNEVMRLVPAKVNRVDINWLLFSLDFKLTVDSVKSEDQVKRALALFIHMIYNFLEWRS